MLAGLGRLLIRLVFPPFCCGCQKPGTFMCNGCYEKIDFLMEPVKLQLEPCYLDEVRAACYMEFPMNKLIYTLKYQSVKDLGWWAGHFLYHTQHFPPFDTLSWVPIHPQRLHERGFNQGQEIAQTLALLLHQPALPLLKKIKHTNPQAQSKSREERLIHLQGVFDINKKINMEKDVAGKSILLIDDVITTGATLNECAKVLKQAGAKKVWAVSLAHGS